MKKSSHSIFQTGKQIATSTTASATVLPYASDGYFARDVLFTATVPTCIKLTNGGSATSGDVLIQPGDATVLTVSGYTGVSAVTLSGTGVLTVSPLENGRWTDTITSLALTFAGATSLDSRITFARADATTCATYFGSDGLLKTAAANIPRFDYDPATPAGVTGGELVTNGTFDNGTSGWTPVTSVLSVANSELQVSGSAGTDRATQQINVTIGKTYKVTATWRRGTSVGGGVYVWSSDYANNYGSVTTQGTGTITFRANTSILELWLRSDAGTAYFDNISVQEVTFTPRGLLIEESRANLLLQSRDMTQSVWGAAGVLTNATAARNAVGLDGSANTANTVTTSNALHAVWQTITVTASTQYTFTFYAKRGTMTDMKYSVYDNTNLADIVAPTSYYAQTDSAGGWRRITVTFTAPVGCLSVRVYPLRDSGVTGTAIVDCAQLEVGAFATSIIPTTTTSLTRAADSASMTGTNFSSWFNANAGTFVAETSSGVTNGRVFTVSDGTVTNQIFSAYGSGSVAQQVYTSGVFQAQQGAFTSGKLAAAYATNDFAVSINSSIPLADTSGSLSASYTRLDVGQSWNATTQYNGWIRRLTYYPQRLPNATLQALTA